MVVPIRPTLMIRYSDVFWNWGKIVSCIATRQSGCAKKAETG
jgi:hypothetical protein